MRGTKRSRSASQDIGNEAQPSHRTRHDTAEASRKLPRLQARAVAAQPRALVRHDSSEDEDDKDEVIGGNGVHVGAQLPPPTHVVDSEGVEMRRTQSTSSSEGQRRFTAQEKGKGRAAAPSVTPEVFEVDSDSSDDVPLAANESVQFISSSVVPEAVDDEDTAEAIDEHSGLTAFSE